MKIQKLVVTAFGPYALRQELDFEKNLQGKNMFVITGNTGAGKTTIFDAINFALYGDTSGSDREVKSLRSDFADPGTPTEVELWFSLRGREYYVKRTPAYIKPKQRGEGFVENKPSAEIRLSKDKTVTGVNQVTKEIENILGITTEQFKQLVMIPQGEFKRLLNAKSEEKEDIFRKIFGTEVFQSIQNQIKQQANKLEKGIKEIQRDRANKIKSFSCKEKDEELFRLINADVPNIELLMKSFYDFIEGDKEEQHELEKNMEEKSALLDKISKEMALGEATNKKIDNFQKNKEQLDKLKEQTPEYDNKKLQFNRAKKALTVKCNEDKYIEKHTRFKKLELEVRDIEKRIENYKESYIKVEKQFNDQKCREQEKNQLIKDIDENQRLKDKVSKYETNKSNVDSLEKKVKALKDRIKGIGQITSENDRNIQVINTELERIKKAKEDKYALEIKQINCRNKTEKLNKLIDDIDSWIKQSEKHKKLTLSFEAIDKKFKVSKEEYEFLEDTFRKNQAGILASNLKEGEPCPVCGSTHHINLAKLENSEITEEAVKNSKVILEQIRVERDKKLNELTDVNSSLKSIKDNSIAPPAKELLNREDSFNVIEIRNEAEHLDINNKSVLSELACEMQKLNSMINTESEKVQAVADMQKSNDSLRKELEIKNEERSIEEGKLSAAQNMLDTIKNDFKGEMKTAKELVEIGKAINYKLQCLNKAYEEAEKNFNLIKGNLDQEMGRHKTANEMKENADKELKESIRVFKESVLALGFKGYEDYKASSLTEERIEDIDKEINDFNIKLAGAEKVYEASLKEIEGLSRVNLDALKEKLALENSNKEALNKDLMIIFARISSNKAILENCKKYNSQIENDEKKYEVVGKLSSIANGDNSKKISFERYVLASYFEDIIVAANLRFNKMTSGRFELLRKQDVGDMRKGQGLELEVFDNYTGKARDVKTLSGGESFKASLSMALGLADVVQAYSGGIQLDTMFIDEGFGTLDPESLDNAIECLMDLQKDGRLVGIISHVPELKERIDARLEVTTTNKGSMAEFRV